MKRANFLCATWGATAAVLLLVASPARADDPAKILKSMTDYLGSQKTLSASFESDIEIITPELQKIQFTSSGQMKLSRPDKLRVRRTGGYTDIDLVYDGKTISLYGNDAKTYVQADAPGTVDQMIAAMQARSGLGMPGTDLILSNAYDELMATTTESKHVGQGVIDGVECEHLAFRTPETDWQIWIEPGEKPVPRKYVITSKTMTGAPQYTLRIRDWKTDAFADADTFVFKAPAGASKIDLESAAIADFDELPPGTPQGAKQ
ncbi:DUF2092 domain-containing protein [Bradyrhizobium manausense]|uniref:DUF2092 domain-containing protein n=1 Tax=Bradyrhizobium TaxID=374 RepID=UPI001BA69025|nr:MULTISPECIES: DUF2092 domain-containing protein [Bradyrhizobium]MBR0827555.1 DUF2092 domain-containing protein [Bradyrhizobium manausense]UVO26041.1 DUF2092 domain-containing protein [Bradyrhizobium arachidis]